MIATDLPLTDTDPRTLLTLADIAARFHFSESTARRLAADDDFPPHALVTGGNRRFWRREDIEAYACTRKAVR